MKLKLLLDYQHRLQRFQSKIELAIELIHKAEAMGINAETYGFDSWFLGKDMIQVIAGYDKDWISILKSNWNLMMKIEKIFEIYQPERVYISSMIVQDVNLAQAEFDKICYIAAEHKASVFVGGWGFNTIEFNHPVVERRFHSFEELDSSLSKLLEVVAQSDN